MTAQRVALFLLLGGLFVLISGLVYEWLDRKLVARLKNRIGPRWFQPAADMLTLLAKEEVIPDGTNALVFNALPVVAVASVLTAGPYVPLAGMGPAWGFSGDLIVTIYLLSVVSVCVSLAGATTHDRFSKWSGREVVQ